MSGEHTLTRSRWWQRRRGDHVERRVLTQIPGTIIPTLAGVSVTAQTALRLIDVLACVRLLSETASSRAALQAPGAALLLPPDRRGERRLGAARPS